MIAKDLVSGSIMPLRTSDTALIANSLMEEFKVRHMPIVNNEQFLGLISEEEVFEIPEPEAAIGSLRLKHTKPFVYEHQHIYDVIKIIAEQQLSLIPVLDTKENYTGVISALDLINEFAHLTSANIPGSIIVLEMNVHDYQVSQIGGIIEENDARILSLYVKQNPNSTKIEVVVKVNKTDIQPIIHSFERFEYTIKERYNDAPSDDLFDRYNSLMKYLNI